MRPALAGDKPAITLRIRLRIAREHAELTQVQLAALLHLNPATIASYESGRTVPPHPTVMAWAQACGVDLGWLAGDSHPEAPRGGRAAITLRALQGIAVPVALAATALGGQMTGT